MVIKKKLDDIENHFKNISDQEFEDNLKKAGLEEIESSSKSGYQMEDRFEEIKNFVVPMAEYFRPVQVMKIKIKDALWLIDEIERLRRNLN